MSSNCLQERLEELMDFLLRVAGLSFEARVRRRRVLFLFIKRTQLRLLGASGQGSSLKCVSVFRSSWWRELWRGWSGLPDSNCCPLT